MSIWNQAFADARRTSCVTDGPAAGLLDVHWYTQFEAYIHPTVQPVTDGAGNVYVATAGGLFALDSAGLARWSVGGNYACTPAVVGPHIYAADSAGLRVHKLNLADGSLAATWAGVAQAGFAADLLATADGAHIIVGCRDYNVYCLATGDMSLAWTFATGGPVLCGPATDGTHVYILACDQYAYKVALATGLQAAKSAKLPGDGFVRMPPVVDVTGGILFVPCSFPLYKAFRGWTPNAGAPDHAQTNRAQDKRDVRGAITWMDTTPVFAESVETEAGHPWPVGARVLDLAAMDTRPTPPPNDALTYHADQPYRRVRVLLNLADLTEYTVAGAAVPFLGAGTYSGNLQPPMIDAADRVWVDTWNDWAINAFVDCSPSLWERGTARIAPIGLTHVFDEPAATAIGNGVIHQALTAARYLWSWDSAGATQYRHCAYAGVDAVAPGFSTQYGGSTHLERAFTAFGGWNGVYGVHTFHGQPVPVSNTVYTLLCNALLAWRPGAAQCAVNPTLPAVAYPQPALVTHAAARLAAAVAAVIAAGHLRPGFANHGQTEGQLDHAVYNVPHYTIYGKYSPETLLPLLAAYEHLQDADLRVALLAYVREEYANWSLPRASRIPDTGAGHAVREWADVPPDARIAATWGADEDYGNEAKWRIFPLHWYLAWRVYDQAGIANPYAALKANTYLAADYADLRAHNVARDVALRTWPYALNAHLAGLYGRWQLALAAGAVTDAAEVKAVLDAYVTFWNANFTADTPFVTAQTSGAINATTVARNWLWLTPEVAALIRADASYDQAAIDAALAQNVRCAPYWHWHRVPATVGEAGSHHWRDRALFGALAWLQGADKAELASYLDSSGFAVGDNQWIANLATFLAASGSEYTGEPAFAAWLLAAGEQEQLIQFNPVAALQKRIFADGFVPNSPEFRRDWQTSRLVCQRAERLSDGAVRVYYAREGAWDTVGMVERGGGGE